MKKGDKIKICQIKKQVTVNNSVVCYLTTNDLNAKACRTVRMDFETTGIDPEKYAKCTDPIYNEARRMFFEAFM